MQGKYSSELALPLNELLTVVLITHNRPAFLRRAVKYYSSLPCRIMVLDSTPERPEGTFPPSITITCRSSPTGACRPNWRTV